MLNKYCPTCLSVDRNLEKLSEDQNVLLEKILPHFEFKMNAKLCWECVNTIIKIISFCDKAKSADIILKNCTKKMSSMLKSKSQLCVSKITYVNINVKENELNGNTSEDMKWKINKVENNVQNSNVNKINNKKKMNKNKTVYKCNMCAKLFKTRGSYEYHRQRHKSKPECKECNIQFLTKSLLSTHNNIVHKNVQKYKCNVCKRIFFTELGYQTHVEKHSNGQNVYYCKPCDKFYKSNSSYLKHKRMSAKHFDPKIWKHECPRCNKRYQSNKQLEEHYNVIHLNIKKYDCKLCSKGYSTERSLNYHVRVKHKNVEIPKNHMCHICGKVFKSTQILDSHTRTHTKLEKNMT